MARDNTWTFSQEEVKRIVALQKREFKVGAGETATGYYDDETGKFYECDQNGNLTGRVGNAKKQATIVIPAATDPNEKNKKPKSDAAAQQNTESSDASTDGGNVPDWRELKRQEEERLKAEKQREREQKKQKKNAGKDRQVSASDAAGTSMVPVSPFARVMKKVVLPIVAALAGAALIFCLYCVFSYHFAPAGFMFPSTVQRGDGAAISTSYVSGDQQVIQVTDDILPGTMLTKENLSAATIPASVYNYAVAVGAKPCGIDLATEIIGTYATEYIGAGQYLLIDQYSTTSLAGANVVPNPWLAGDGEDVRDYLWTEDTGFLMFGRKAIITIQRTVDDNNPALQEELYKDKPSIEYTITEKDQYNRRYETIKIYAVVSDLLNSDGDALYENYAKLGAVPQGELEQYIKNHVSVSKMVPSIVRFRMTEACATVYDAAIVVGADTTMTSGSVTSVELLEELEADTPERTAQLGVCQFVDKILCGGSNTASGEDPVE